MTPEFRGIIEAVVGSGALFDNREELYAYSFDATPLVQAQPDLIVFPHSTEQVAKVLALCNEEQVPVIPRGAGTNLAGGTIPVEGGVILNMTRLNQVLEVDERNLTVTVQPGVVTADLHELVENRGLFYPPDPGSMRVSTLTILRISVSRSMQQRCY